MSLLGVRSKYGTLPVETGFVSDGAAAGGVIAAGTPVTLSASTGKLAQCADNAVSAYGVALTATAAGDEALAVVPGGDDIIFRFTYTGDDPGITGIGDFYGTDGSQVDLGNTTQELFKLLAVGTDPFGTAYCDVTIPSSLCEAIGEVD
ncbi:MAG: hypothetical protein ACYC7E_18900 [Armatimonadota bacterium]